MKKNFGFILGFILVIASCTLGIVGCTKPPHTHRWITEFRKDDSYHWYDCNGCDKRNYEIAHSYTDGFCICGYQQPPESLKYKEDGDGYVVVGFSDATGAEIIIPSKFNGKEVKAIGECAFAGADGLTNVVIPDRESISDLHPTISY